MKNQLSLTLIFLLFSIHIVCAQTVIHVPGDKATIQEALDAAESGTTILVAPGTYFGTTIWPADIDGIKLIGVEGKEKTILDGQGNRRVIEMESTYPNDYTEATMIEGFTIQNGFTISSDSGSGLKFSGGSPIFRDLIFRNNEGRIRSYRGVGAQMIRFGGLLERCDFIGNEINSDWHAYGAGLYLDIMDTAELRECTFDGNHGEASIFAFGGGLHVSTVASSAAINISNCSFNNNSLTTDNNCFGGGVYIESGDDIVVRIDSTVFENNTTNNISYYSRGGALHTSLSNIEITNCLFISNSARVGTGIYFDQNSFLNRRSLIKNSSFSNNISFAENSDDGGVIHVSFDPMGLTLENCIVDHNIGQSIYQTTGELNLNHCTIAHNSRPLRFIRDVDLNAKNSIFWNDSAIEIDEGWIQENDILFEKCVVKNGFSLQDIISDDPDFIDEFLLIPSFDSPCLGAGFLTDSNTDILSLPRPLPAGSNPDIGAYEVGQDIAHVQVKFFNDETLYNYNSSPFYIFSDCTRFRYVFL